MSKNLIHANLHKIVEVDSDFEPTGIKSEYLPVITVPTKVSDLVNDTGFITIDSVPTNVSSFTNDAGYITLAQVPTVTVPTKTSDLTNDSGFITISSVPTKTSDLTNDSGFITAAEVPDGLPDQTGQNGKFLTTDGSVASWGTVSGGGGTELPPITGESGKYLYTDGTNILWKTKCDPVIHSDISRPVGYVARGSTIIKLDYTSGIVPSKSKFVSVDVEADWTNRTSLAYVAC